MNDQTFRSTAAKSVAAAALLGAAWTFTVRPARADLEGRRSLLDAQQATVAAFESDARDQDAAKACLDELTARVAGFETSLTRHATATSVFQQVERFATGHGVQIHRTDPRGTGVPVRGDGPEAPAGPAFYADEYSIEFSGPYGPVVALIDDLQERLGVTRVEDVRLSVDRSVGVRGSLSLTVFRADPGTRIADPAAGEEDHDS